MARWSLFLLPCAAVAACSATQAPPPPRSSAIAMIDGPRLTAPRATHAMVRTSNGALLVIGGCVENGCDPGPASATVDIISADGTRLLRTGRLRERRVQPSAVALADGRALILGGWVEGRVSASTELFDPATGRSVEGPRLPRPLSSPTVVALRDGRILIAGGYDGREATATALLYDPRANRFAMVGSLLTARSGATGTLLRGGKILIAGGGDGESAGRRALASAELFDPATARFSRTANLAQRRYKHGAVALPDGDALLVGGSDERDYGGKLASVERYDTATGRFVAAGRLASARFKLADGIMLIGPGKLLVAAGDQHPELFDIAAGRGKLLDGDLGGQWNYMTLARVGNNSALLVGGYREGRIQPTDRTWLFRL